MPLLMKEIMSVPSPGVLILSLAIVCFTCVSAITVGDSYTSGGYAYLENFPFMVSVV